MPPSFLPNKALINRGQGFQGLGLCLFLPVLPAAWLIETNLLLGGILLLLGGLPGVLLFLKGRSISSEGSEGLLEGELAPPQSPLLQILRTLACFVATGFILLTILGLLGGGLAATIGNPNNPGQAPLGDKEGLPWYAFVILPLYLIAWFWALYLTFPRFQSLGARIGLGVLLAISIPGAFLIVGLGAAIAIPALNQAKKDAQAHIAQNLLKMADESVRNFESQHGRPPSSWKEINLTWNGKPIEGPQHLEGRLPKGSQLEIRGINGATSTRLLLPDGRSITPSTNLTAESQGTQQEEEPAQPPSHSAGPTSTNKGGELILREINQRLPIPPGWRGLRADPSELPGLFKGGGGYKITSPSGDGEFSLLITTKDSQVIPRGDELATVLEQANLTSRFDRSQIQSVKPPTVAANGKAATTTILAKDKGKLCEYVVFVCVIDNRILFVSRISTTPAAKTHLQTIVRAIKI